MVRRPGDKTPDAPDAPGGRVAERLRMYLGSRGAVPPQVAKPRKVSGAGGRPKGKGDSGNAKDSGRGR